MARILIVDDQAANAKLLGAMLRGEHELLFADSGPRALEVAREGRPDLVLLDVMLPGMHGFEVCQKLKADPDLADVPVIFVTALDDVQDEAKGFQAGGVDYVTKPVSAPVVQARVRVHLELQAARRRLQRQNEILAENLELQEQVDMISRHDLRTPITGILGAALLLQDPEVEEREELLVGIVRSGRRMLEMVNLSLALLHMEKGTYEPKPVPIDLREQARRVVRDLASQAAAGEVTFRFRPEAAEPLPALGEEVLAYAALANLIKNAVEASPPGREVTLEFESLAEGARVRIHNVGAVPEHLRASFFQKYSSAKPGGSGLGAYSARLMVLAQKGQIRMDSSEERGTTLEMVLPQA